MPPRKKSRAVRRRRADPLAAILGMPVKRALALTAAVLVRHYLLEKKPAPAPRKVINVTPRRNG